MSQKVRKIKRELAIKLGGFMGQLASKRPTPKDKILLQRQHSSPLDPSDNGSSELLKGQQVQESLKKWEDAKATLNEIQVLLSQAYRDLELMEIEY